MRDVLAADDGRLRALRGEGVDAPLRLGFSRHGAGPDGQAGPGHVALRVAVAGFVAASALARTGRRGEFLDRRRESACVPATALAPAGGRKNAAFGPLRRIG